MRIGQTQLWRMAVAGTAVVCSSVAWTSPLHHAFPPLPATMPWIPPAALYGDASAPVPSPDSSRHEVRSWLHLSKAAQTLLGMPLQKPHSTNRQEQVAEQAVEPLASEGMLAGR